MSRAITDYLDIVMVYANRNPAETMSIRAELEDHILKKVSVFESKGLAREDAIFQALKEYGSPRVVGYGLRPRFPLVDVRSQGCARGFIAIGPRAVGFIAFGGVACGVISFGGVSAGIFSMGGLALSLILAFGGFAFAPVGIAYGGFALGLMAFGGFACGICAAGACALGVWVPMAAKGLSYLPTDTIPAFFKELSRFMMSYQWVVQAGFLGTFLPLLLVSGWLQLKETARVQKADPEIAQYRL
jgi:hypothetical protein